jgi:hypothetical protein
MSLEEEKNLLANLRKLASRFFSKISIGIAAFDAKNIFGSACGGHYN